MLAFGLPALIAPSVVAARASSALPYPLPETFSTAVRFIRVDRGCQVTDKDPDAAFVTFTCEEEGSSSRRGSLELYPTDANGQPAVRVQVTLGDESHGTELRFLELLERKLKEERGTPVPVPGKKPKAPVDGGSP
jgi:hypothetical protein